MHLDNNNGRHKGTLMRMYYYCFILTLGITIHAMPPKNLNTKLSLPPQNKELAGQYEYCYQQMINTQIINPPDNAKNQKFKRSISFFKNNYGTYTGNNPAVQEYLKQDRTPSPRSTTNNEPPSPNRVGHLLCSWCCPCHRSIH